MLENVQVLGERVERAWSERGNDVAAFADIATEALIDSELLQTLSPTELINWFVSHQDIPEQHYRAFGQPPINLYVGKGFLIEALFWVDSTTTIHQHAFGGAFGVLAGSSVHSLYDFYQKETISREIILGEINFISSELLKQGDVRSIHPGNRFIHALFHLDRPSISVVVRTKSNEDLKPQYQYVKPWVAFDPFYKPEPFMTQIRLLDSLKRTNMELFWKTAKSIIDDSSIWMLFMVLSTVYHKFHTSEGWRDLIEYATSRYGSVVEYLIACLREQSREIKIIARREAIHSPVHRFFLALLLNVPNKKMIHSLIADRFPQHDPLALMVEWIGQLSHEKLLATDTNPLSHDLLKFAIRGDSYDSARRLVAPPTQPAGVEDETKIRAIWDGIISEPVLRPLFL